MIGFRCDYFMRKADKKKKKKKNQTGELLLSVDYSADSII